MPTICYQNSEDIFGSQMLSNKVKKLEKHDVHLWGIHRNAFNELKNYSEYYLNDDEQNRARRYLLRQHHDLFVIGRYVTKVLLAYYSESTTESVKIIPDPFGKPNSELDLFFNISHSDDQLLLGFSKSEIGVDIEKTDPSVKMERIGESHFSEIEFQKIMNCTKAERTDTFFDIWTKKESVVKGIGKGLHIPLRDFNVTNPNGKVMWEFPAEKIYGDWYVKNHEPIQGYKSAFATQNEFVDLSYFSHDNF